MRNLFILLVIIYSINLFGQTVDIETAAKVAKNLYIERAETNMSDELVLLSENVRVLNYGEIPALYVFEREHAPGYVIIAADKSVFPVIAYSFESDFQTNSLPPAFTWWIEQRIQQIGQTIHSGEKNSADKYITKEWEHYLNQQFHKTSNTIQSVSPLLETRWNQGCYYNELCPSDANAPEGACGRVWTGCVATAMGQVMKYHNYPPQGSGSKVYYHGLYGTLSVNFSEQYYDWAVMENILTQPGYNMEVAKLMFHCGVSVRMNYGIDGSGAYSHEAAIAFVEHFRYAPYLSLQKKEDYPDHIWAETLKEEIRAKRPLFYRGFSDNYGGHAFICDGFQGNNHFHFDFGWGGSGNGYFYLNNVNGFKIDQGAILSVEPPSENQYCESLEIRTEASGNVSDKSGTNRYANETSCKWLIQPEGADAIVLEFTKLATETDVDRILIYQGDSEHGQLIAQISGYKIPEHPIVVSGGSMFIWFITDEMNMSSGWEAEYHSWMTDINEYSATQIRVYPNPVQDLVHIEMPHTTNNQYVLQIQDMCGKTVLYESVTSDSSNHTLDISAIGSGVYFIYASDNAGIVVREKIIKL